MKKLIEFPSKPFDVHWNKVAISFLLALFLSIISFTEVFPQSLSDDGDWTQPVNISRSGSGSYPFVVVDSNNVAHAVWFDIYEGAQHAQVGEDGIWTEPKGLILPFENLQPRVIVTPNDYVYTFWLSERTLMYSRVKSTTLGVSATWASTQTLATDVLAFDVFQDEDSTLHLVYIQQTQLVSQPTGIYYRSKPINRGWSLPVAVYTSPYFRTIRPSQAFVSIAVGGINSSDGDAETEIVRKLFVAWDDPLLNRSMITSSVVDSNQWEEPAEVDPHVMVSESTRSFGPSLAVWNHQVVLVWKKELSETTCEIRFKKSSDGQKWTEAAEQFTSMNGCPEDSGFLIKNENYLVWHGIVNEQVVLTAWNGEKWSEPRTELDLSEFRDIATGSYLSIGSRNFYYDPETSNLSVIGIDVNGIQDIWLTQKVLDDIEDWFLSYSSWNPAQIAGVVETDVESLNLESDSEDKLHALWLQPVEALETSLVSSMDLTYAVHYTYWDGEGWSEVLPAIAGDEDGIEELSTAIDHSNNLMAIWRGDTGCRISFTRAPAARASNPVEWMEPVDLPTPDRICSSPSLAIGNNQVVYAIYALAVNEGRGIYINRLIDGGREWEEPIQVFDAQTASWDMVGKPTLAIQGDRMYAHWEQPSPLNPEYSNGFGFAYSDDGGVTWTTQEYLTEEKLRWSSLAVSENGVLVRVWQQYNSEYAIINSQDSVDGGQTWGSELSIAKDGEVVGSPELITDTNGVIHLFQVIRDSFGKLTMHHWIRYNNDWIAREKLPLGYDLNINHFQMASIVTQQTQLMVLFTGYDNENSQTVLESVLSQVGVDGGFEVDNIGNASVPSSTDSSVPAEGSLESVPETPTASPSPIPTFSTVRSDDSSSISTWIGPIAGAVLGGLVVAGAFIIGVLKKRR
jgi:hypothetical protein